MIWWKFAFGTFCEKSLLKSCMRPALCTMCTKATTIYLVRFWRRSGNSDFRFLHGATIAWRKLLLEAVVSHLPCLLVSSFLPPCRSWHITAFLVTLSQPFHQWNSVKTIGSNVCHITSVHVCAWTLEQKISTERCLMLFGPPARTFLFLKQTYLMYLNWNLYISSCMLSSWQNRLTLF